MKALIAKLEAATEGSRELDGEIALSLGWVKHHKGWAHWATPEGLENRHVPFFSDSLDAALMLVPEGWGWTIEWDCIAAVRPPESEGDDELAMWGLTPNGTPALALCIAALRARQAMEDAA